MATSDDIQNIFNSFISIFQNPLDRVNALITVFGNLGYDEATKAITTTQDDKSAVIFRCYCLSYIAYTVPNIDFTSSSDALNLLDQINDIFEAQLKDDNISGDTFSWLSRLKTKITTDISTRGSVLPQINQFTCEMLPLPVISQYLYQTGARSDEILIRNNNTVVHPLFYSGTLEVLSS
ncbi:hypothetical protein [Acetobacter pasteurianus]|uniref:Uncharacterized protein n=1 Tax=Acetobacter pasteurianus subsp. pasteurianus TaxID=481145 RepID=A0A1Y0Y2R6_ACEPA|nr:hypothetical protein [Acetobacter pasteurianus]ARW49490.1 hypothetical protein S1001342_03200 [Acetobacter pasteurianus subsp. pasteurianus]